MSDLAFSEVYSGLANDVLTDRRDEMSIMEIRRVWDSVTPEKVAHRLVSVMIKADLAPEMSSALNRIADGSLKAPDKPGKEERLSKMFGTPQVKHVHPAPVFGRVFVLEDTAAPGITAQPERGFGAYIPADDVADPNSPVHRRRGH